jgi:hypothetical protein
LTDDEERELKAALMQADLDLRKKQIAWETPRNIAILVGAVAAITGAIAGWTGYRIGQNTPPPAPPQIIFQPGSIVVQPTAPAK